MGRFFDLLLRGPLPLIRYALDVFIRMATSWRAPLPTALGLCGPCTSGIPVHLHPHLPETCPRCRQFAEAQAAFRLAQYWTLSGSQRAQRHLVREGQRAVIQLLGYPADQNPTPPALVHGMEEEMFVLMSRLIDPVPVQTHGGWAFIGSERVLRLLHAINGPLPHVPGVEVIGSDAAGIDTPSYVGAELPSTSMHIISVGMAGNQYAFSRLPVAIGFRHTSAPSVAAAFSRVALPPPARVRLYVADQGDINHLVCEYCNCIFCNATVFNDPRANDVIALATAAFAEGLGQTAMNMKDWPKLDAALGHIGIDHMSKVVVGPLHWIALATTAFLRIHWQRVGGWIRAHVPECDNLNLDDDAPRVVAGVVQQAKGISINQLTHMFTYRGVGDQFSDEKLTAQAADGTTRTTSARETFRALQRLRLGARLKWKDVANEQQRIVDSFFVLEHPTRARYWTRGMHQGLHIAATLRLHDLEFGDVWEQSVEHLNQAADQAALQYNGNGVRIAKALLTTGLLIEAGHVAVVPVHHRAPRKGRDRVADAAGCAAADGDGAGAGAGGGAGCAAADGGGAAADGAGGAGADACDDDLARAATARGRQLKLVPVHRYFT